ncbi:hypothetical protein H072_10426 [Dactylellina haptotyla CBS 200.50]|uniref:Uncharacterized protein n=1 Tax=Dactylellina haptotyla (strain CBS 200.50) TaxID=1284197 RepID=S8BLH8_DACHA|nr:hypothetical protein H072_10426 [Dactylellina haptotyla CBS 200.50]
MATATESVPDVATSVTPDPRRASTAPTEESASGVGLADHRQTYHHHQPPEDEDEEMQDPDHGDAPPEDPLEPPQDEEDDGGIYAQPPPPPPEAFSPAADYLMGIMAEFRKLEGKLSSLLNEHAKVKDENEELRTRPPPPDLATLQDLETLTTKYNKVKKLYFQKETQIEELTKENDALRNDADEFSKELDSLKAENTELNRDLDILVKERDTLTSELQDVIRERDSLTRQRDTLDREREVIIRERDSVIRDRDQMEKEKDDAVQIREEAIIERDDARHDRESLQNRIKDLEDEVAKLQAQGTSNGVRDKRVSASAHNSTGSDYPQEILKLKYDKVKRLYYEQQKTIAHLEERLRNAEAPRGDQLEVLLEPSYKKMTEPSSSEPSSPASRTLPPEAFPRRTKTTNAIQFTLSPKTPDSSIYGLSGMQVTHIPASMFPPAGSKFNLDAVSGFVGTGKQAVAKLEQDLQRGARRHYGDEAGYYTILRVCAYDDGRIHVVAKPGCSVPEEEVEIPAGMIE